MSWACKLVRHGVVCNRCHCNLHLYRRICIFRRCEFCIYIKYICSRGDSRKSFNKCVDNTVSHQQIDLHGQIGRSRYCYEWQDGEGSNLDCRTDRVRRYEINNSWPSCQWLCKWLWFEKWQYWFVWMLLR